MADAIEHLELPLVLYSANLNMDAPLTLLYLTKVSTLQVSLAITNPQTSPLGSVMKSSIAGVIYLRT